MENVLVKRIENSINLKLYFTENSFDWTHDDVYGNEEKTNKYHNRRTFHMFAHCTVHTTINNEMVQFPLKCFLTFFFRSDGFPLRTLVFGVTQVHKIFF